ncbi:hypothetical protein LJB86_03430 [Deltaproteobacteria bacterium OttesenSCG-928-M10]|nr:hypothetical protein [Deltaproteobacteria bacterium OttesenSCG-928-M10]
MKRYFIIISCCVAALLLASACEKREQKHDAIRIASKDFSEQYILGEILRAMVLEHTGLEVELTAGIAGETSIIMPAMVKGDFDLYPEYDSTAWMTVLKKPKNSNLEAMHREMLEIYQKEYNMSWLGFYGFDNTYRIAVRRETAEEYGLKNFSDLVKHSGKMTFGAGYEFFEREDGYAGLQELYGFNFKKILEMNLSLKYVALLDGQVDAITIYKTDGRMDNPDIVELEDDKGYFPPALCGTIIRNEVLEAHPELGRALKMLNGGISNEEMTLMNAAVDMRGQDARQVALEFLQRKGLINGN